MSFGRELRMWLIFLNGVSEVKMLFNDHLILNSNISLKFFKICSKLINKKMLKIVKNFYKAYHSSSIKLAQPNLFLIILNNPTNSSPFFTNIIEHNHHNHSFTIPSKSSKYCHIFKPFADLSTHKKKKTKFKHRNKKRRENKFFLILQALPNCFQNVCRSCRKKH